jgi:hypothetical protein
MARPIRGIARLAEMFASQDSARTVLVVSQTFVGKQMIDLLEWSEFRATIRLATVIAG